MVTRILFDPRRDLPLGVTGSTTVILEATPTGIREDGSVVILPTKLSFTVDNGDDVVQLAPPAASWGWRIVVRDAVTSRVLQQRTVRFPDLPSVAYADLTDVDPASLGDTVGHSRQWDATFYQLTEMLKAAVPSQAGVALDVDGVPYLSTAGSVAIAYDTDGVPYLAA
jgi:hypothetical protein